MPPVQFQCGSCGKIMAVGSEHLGKQVRCPHCQQVVVAPPPAVETPPPPPTVAPDPFPPSAPAEAPPPGLTETVFQMPAPSGNAEDIFSPADVSDDLFGRSEPPRIEMPPEPLLPTLPPDNPIPPPPLEETLASTMPWLPPSEPAAAAPSHPAPFGGSEGTEVLTAGGESPWMSGGATETLPLPPNEMPPPPDVPLGIVGESSVAPARTRGREQAKVPWFLLVVFLPLLLYAIVMTSSTIWLYFQAKNLKEQIRHPFEIMPDEGDKPGAQKDKKISLWNYKPNRPTQPLPENLRTTLGKPLRIGDLEVTPDRVERKRVRVIEETFNPEFCAADSLVLYLRMKNLSSEYAFAPLDNYFDRRYDGGARPPFTLLQLGDRYQFYGGPAEWYPLGDSKHRRVWVEGRNNLPDVLEPGEQKELFVCTNGYDEKAATALFGGERPYHGSFLWRVRVRRGLVHFEGKDYSTTAVIGVRFSDKDVVDATVEAQ